MTVNYPLKRNRDWQAWIAMRNSPLGATIFRDAIPVDEDGRYRIEGLVPESYQLFVNDGGKRLRGYTSFTVSPAARDADGPQLGETRVTRGAEYRGRAEGR